MLEWLGIMKDSIALVADSKAIVLGGASSVAIFSAAGLIPRVGFVRALTFGWGSYFKKSYPLSVRTSEIKKLNKSILSIERGSYITVIGGKGNGKSCLIDTALNGHFGVAKIGTKSGADKDVIIDQALCSITGINLRFQDPKMSSRQTLFFYSLLFKCPPIVVIRVPERQMGESYAQVTSAVRALADDYGLRVIVDGSPNSIPPELLTTKRVTLMVVEPMSKEQIESIPEYRSLIDVLKKHNLDDPVWKVLGGSPQLYLKLKEDMRETASQSATAPEDVVKSHLESELVDALTTNIANSSLNTKKIIEVFRNKKRIEISKMELEALGLLLDFPNKVFREVKMKRDRYVVPVTTAVSLIISEDVKNADGIGALMETIFKKHSKRG